MLKVLFLGNVIVGCHGCVHVRCGLATMRHLGRLNRSTASNTLNAIFPLQINIKKRKNHSS